MYTAPSGSGGSTDTTDDTDTTSSDSTSDDDAWSDTSDDSATYSDRDLYEAADDAPEYEDTSTDDDYEPDGSTTSPTGIQNPANWQVDDGDVVAPPDDHVSDDGDVAGSETVVEDDGSLDINPEGDTTIDPTEQDYTSDPTDDEGAQPTEEPDTALTAWTRAFGGEQALDSIGNVMRDMDPELPEAPDNIPGVPDDASDGAIWFGLAAVAVVVLGIFSSDSDTGGS